MPLLSAFAGQRVSGAGGGEAWASGTASMAAVLFRVHASPGSRASVWTTGEPVVD